MGLGLLTSRALRSSSSRFSSTNTRYILIRTIFSTPEHSKPVALTAATESGIGKLDGARFQLSRFCYHDHLFISGNWRMRLVEVEKSQRTVSSILVALLPALFLGLSLTPAMAEDSSTELTETDLGGLTKIDDGSVVSNIHTSKWRVFTDNGRDLFLQARFLRSNFNRVSLYILSRRESNSPVVYGSPTTVRYQCLP
ncbi:hypothetical protein L2E82_11473 [Cichorium intybus]|uniref:Uncharacterized protein n=1 Tax=Cichorium intybus TaxID=13427 RepID=A0ACB9GEH8_CICIN|nr:hypothetical protein L2E82_11473 [Cichorium intybus]